ncbi:MAG: TetR/AcrR family transcriptional regulator [Alphaproteobacteria bacterium]
MDPADTRENLILAAERLFAEKAIHNVSLREINRAAGQKNVAALHYHFGTREMLLEAIFEHRMDGINRRRVAMLDAMEATGPITQVRPVVTAMVAPLAEQLDPTVRGQHYVRFLAQVISDPGIDLGGLVRDKFDHGMARTRDLLRGLLSDLPAPLVEQRIRQAVAHFVHALADKARRDAGGRTTGRSGGTQLFIANLIDSIAGALTAPVSDETMALLTEVPRKTA